MSNQPELYPVHLQKRLDEMIRERGVLWAYISDLEYRHVDRAALEKSLEGYRLDIVADGGADWLARAVRRALAATSPHPEGLPDELLGNAQRRDILNGISERFRALANDLDDLQPDVISAISAALPGDDAWLEFDQMASRLRFLEDVFSIVASSMKVESGKWITSAKREMRVRRAHFLSPIFEMAFDRKPHVNDRPGSKDLGPWPDFFSRAMQCATGEGIPDLRGIVKEARKRHEQAPIIYPPDFFKP